MEKVSEIPAKSHASRRHADIMRDPEKTASNQIAPYPACVTRARQGSVF